MIKRSVFYKACVKKRKRKRKRKRKKKRKRKRKGKGKGKKEIKKVKNILIFSHSIASWFTF
jgi:hypothetical protein